MSAGAGSRAAAARLRTTATGHPVAADAALALVVYLGLTLGITSAAEVEHDGGRLLGAVLGVPIVAPLAWRRRRPLAVLAAASVAAAVVALTFGPIGAEVAVLVALATVAARAPGARAVPAAALVAVAALALTWGLTADDRLQALVATLAAVAAAIAVGIAARARRAELLALADRAERLERERAQEAELAVAAERARIARELHDVIAHNVSVMVALADGAQHTLDERPDQARAAMEHVSGTGREALTELRGVLGLLRDGDGEAGPGAARNGVGGGAARRSRAPQPGLEDLDELVDRVRAAGLSARLRVEGEPAPLTPLTQVTLYRIVQEALTNVLRHAAGATTVDVALTWTTGAVDVRVSDDGELNGAAAVPGRGLAGMRERAAVHGAELVAGPRPSGGWQVATRLPVARP